MSSNQPQSQTETRDETYLEIWKVEQEYVRTRWAIATFFMSISFAILGFSLQSNLTAPKIIAIRIVGLLIYWFAYVLYQHFYAYTKFLRSYLIGMEASNRTSLDIQSKAQTTLRPVGQKRLQLPRSLGGKNVGSLPTTNLLLVFGIIYTIGVIVLWLLGL